MQLGFLQSSHPSTCDFPILFALQRTALTAMRCVMLQMSLKLKILGSCRFVAGFTGMSMWKEMMGQWWRFWNITIKTGGSTSTYFFDLHTNMKSWLKFPQFRRRFIPADPTQPPSVRLARPPATSSSRARAQKFVQLADYHIYCFKQGLGAQEQNRTATEASFERRLGSIEV